MKISYCCLTPQPQLDGHCRFLSEVSSGNLVMLLFRKISWGKPPSMVWGVEFPSGKKGLCCLRPRAQPLNIGPMGWPAIIFTSQQILRLKALRYDLQTVECSPLKHTIQLVLRNAYQDSNSVAPSDTFCPFPVSPPEAITPQISTIRLVCAA